ncbi:Bromodomain containing protein [Trichomonas vaginalis G3]|uniref:Bromodomain containing protein n=1 Tax=Trichomonas vaginalis (strain ATCC PRA-98 / G3) TaxID=412133 RepID=A2EGN0_TRIV3|nr:acetylation-dependent protein binding [Trichomonas vaginalis G3]EAY08225.1 Bromodomain containing protein [Trichomonas vaginalis G3]KAI5519726.1 acetylation-dependent protein binding [Trichomonas vaginalis G3]|eukprot:XP_001320448.1 Bromodomain containing protein [Trichomonas vaginalis G3]
MNTYDHNYCNKMLSHFKKQPMCKPFLNPVDPVADSCPTYYSIIKHPMDFSTMKKKLAQNQYETVDAFIDDIRLVAKNAKMFNGDSSIIGMSADDMIAEVDKMLAEKCTCPEEEWYFSVQDGSDKLSAHILNAPASVSFIPELTLPDNFDEELLDEEHKAKINEIIEKFVGVKIATAWKFLDRTNRSAILDILKDVTFPEKEKVEEEKKEEEQKEEEKKEEEPKEEEKKEEPKEEEKKEEEKKEEEQKEEKKDEDKKEEEKKEE